jgi:hypothetical protein
MRNDAHKLRDFIRGIFVILFVAAAMWVAIGWVSSLLRTDQAHGLANPLTKGKNVRVFATTTATKVPATGQNCNVTFINLQSEVLFTCFRNDPGDGGIGCNSTIGVPVCSNSANCINSWATRDAVPDALYYGLASAPADGGIHIRIEMGAGCTSP